MFGHAALKCLVSHVASNKVDMLKYNHTATQHGNEYNENIENKKETKYNSTSGAKKNIKWEGQCLALPQALKIKIWIITSKEA